MVNLSNLPELKFKSIVRDIKHNIVEFSGNYFKDRTKKNFISFEGVYYIHKDSFNIHFLEENPKNIGLKIKAEKLICSYISSKYSSKFNL